MDCYKLVNAGLKSKNLKIFKASEYKISFLVEGDLFGLKPKIDYYLMIQAIGFKTNYLVMKLENPNPSPYKMHYPCRGLTGRL